MSSISFQPPAGGGGGGGGGGVFTVTEVSTTAKVASALPDSDAIMLEDPTKPCYVSVTFTNHGAEDSFIELYAIGSLGDVGAICPAGKNVTLTMLLAAGQQYGLYADLAGVDIQTAYEQALSVAPD